MRSPPSVGPRTIPIETIAPWIPSALPRSSRGNASVMIAKPSAKIMAAPIAWKIRNPISQPTDGESPQRTDPSVNTANPEE